MLQLVIPEILAEARGLPLGTVSSVLAVGIFLWMFGWWSHRFWLVMVCTALAGWVGLHESAAYHTEPLLAGLLLALAAGLLALALVRVAAFLAGGMAGLLVLNALVPNLTQTLICFLLCGILGLLLFRVWIMAFTSLAGTLLIFHAGLSMLDRAGTIDAVAWTSHATVFLNWACGIVAGLGMAAQYLWDRRIHSKKNKSNDKKEEDADEIWDLAPPSKSEKYRKAG